MCLSQLMIIFFLGLSLSIDSQRWMHDMFLYIMGSGFRDGEIFRNSRACFWNACVCLSFFNSYDYRCYVHYFYHSRNKGKNLWWNCNYFKSIVFIFLNLIEIKLLQKYQFYWRILYFVNRYLDLVLIMMKYFCTNKTLKI